MLLMLLLFTIPQNLSLPHPPPPFPFFSSSSSSSSFIFIHTDPVCMKSIQFNSIQLSDKVEAGASRSHHFPPISLFKIPQISMILRKISPMLQQSMSLFLLLIFSIFPILIISAAYTSLVFKGCADRNFPDDSTALYKQSRKTLLDALISQSSTSKFYKTATSSSAAMNGLFQCRGDLSNDDCNRCVKRSAFTSHSLCGEALAVRVHLTGCYLNYQIAGFRQTNATELLYKFCGSTRTNSAEFTNRLATALSTIVKGVVENGFYAGGYQSVFVLGQCEGDLESMDCSECVKSAIDDAGMECGSSNSAQVYLEKCYISYTYYPNGVPGGDGKAVSSSAGGGGDGRRTEKTVAIVLGGVVGLGLLAACLLFTKSTFKKKTYTYKYGG